MLRTDRAFGSALLLLMLPAPPPSRASLEGRAKLTDILSAKVQEYRNGGKPLIPTLLDISSHFGVAMGIEKVVPEALNQRMDIDVKQTTVRALLDLCVEKVPGYAWTISHGAIDVYGPEEWNRPENLFNLVIHNFGVDDATVNDANWRLRERAEVASRLALETPSGGPVGVAGDMPGIGGMEQKRATIKMPPAATVREILNQIVSAYGGLVWIARVAPPRLSRVPQGGLWQLVPASAGADIRWFVDPSLSSPGARGPKRVAPSFVF